MKNYDYVNRKNIKNTEKFEKCEKFWKIKAGAGSHPELILQTAELPKLNFRRQWKSNSTRHT